MSNNIINDILYLMACEWVFMLLSLSLLISRKKVLEMFEGIYHLIGQLLVSATAVLGFITEALYIFVGNFGLQGGYYISDFWMNHFIPWFLFVILADFVNYLIARIIFIIENISILSRRFLTCARLAFYPKESRNLVIPQQRVVLLQ